MQRGNGSTSVYFTIGSWLKGTFGRRRVKGNWDQVINAGVRTTAVTPKR
jgi:hypothetical protein